MASVGRYFPRFANRFEAVAISSLAALNLHLLDSSASKAYLIDYLRLLELNCQLLREHARCQPERVVVPIGEVFMS